MRRLALVVSTLLLLTGVAACGSDEPVAMPDVVGKRLDIAVSDIERAGFEDDVEVLGGGTFGVLDETNWTVCSQEPQAGNDLAGAPRISVDRSCDSGDAIDQSKDSGRDSDSASAGQDKDNEPASTRVKRQKKEKRKQGRGSRVETFTMPILVGMNLQRAQNKLQDHGSFLLTQTDGTGQGRFQMLDYNWKVCAQDPVAGVDTDVATLVELVTVKLSESC
jgi:beta-lactam-binding protein with PASTA domain